MQPLVALLAGLSAIGAWFSTRIAKVAGPYSPAALLMKAIAARWKAFVRWTIKTFHGRPVMGTMAFVSLGPVLAIAGLVLGVVVVVMLLAALAPVFFPAVKNLTTAISGADTGSTLANTILGIIAIVVPLALVFGFVALIFLVAAKMKGHKSV